MLDGLTCDPYILDSVSMSSPQRFKAGHESTENIRRVPVILQNRLTLKATRGSQPLLPDVWILGRFGAELEFC